MMLDTPILRAISHLTHAEGVKTTWPYDRWIRFGNIGDDMWVLALIRVGRIPVPVRVLRAMENFAEKNDLKFPGHEDGCLEPAKPHNWIAAVRWGYA